MRGTFRLQVNNTNYFRANASLENTYLSGILYAIVGSKAIGKGTGIDNCEFCRNIEFQNANLALELDKTKPNSTRFGVSIGTDLKFDSTGKITDLLSKVFPAVKGAKFEMDVTRASNGSSVSYSIHFLGTVTFGKDRVLGGYVQFLSESDEGTCNPGKGVEVTFERKPKNGDPNMTNTRLSMKPCIRFHLSKLPFSKSTPDPSLLQIASNDGNSSDRYIDVEPNYTFHDGHHDVLLAVRARANIFGTGRTLGGKIN